MRTNFSLVGAMRAGKASEADNLVLFCISSFKIRFVSLLVIFDTYKMGELCGSKPDNS